MNNTSNDIQIQSDYWNRELDAFSRIYSQRKSKLSVLLDRIFRRDMFERFQFTIENCAPFEGDSFLDVGCGTGIYDFELVRRGAARVVGIDIAENMIRCCREGAEQNGCADRCTFVHADLLEYQPDCTFNVTFGIGLFDYIPDPLPVLEKMRGVTSDKVIVSFPRFWTWRAPLRKLRLTLRGCPVYFFTRRKVSRLMTQAGFASHSITRIGKLHCVIARVKD